MPQTNTKQCQDAKRGGSGHEGSRNTCRGDCNGDHGNSPFANSLFVEKLANNCISNFSITKNGPRSNQLNKILDMLSDLCQDKHYDYIPDVISTNIEPT